MAQPEGSRFRQEECGRPARALRDKVLVAVTVMVILSGLLIVAVTARQIAEVKQVAAEREARRLPKPESWPSTPRRRCLVQSMTPL